MAAMEIYSDSTGINSGKLGCWIWIFIWEINGSVEGWGSKRQEWIYRIPNQHKYEEWNWDGERLYLYLVMSSPVMTFSFQKDTFLDMNSFILTT